MALLAAFKQRDIGCKRQIMEKSGLKYTYYLKSMKYKTLPCQMNKKSLIFYHFIQHEIYFYVFGHDGFFSLVKFNKTHNKTYTNDRL